MNVQEQLVINSLLRDVVNECIRYDCLDVDNLSVKGKKCYATLKRLINLFNNCVSLDILYDSLNLIRDDSLYDVSLIDFYTDTVGMRINQIKDNQDSCGMLIYI